MINNARVSVKNAFLDKSKSIRVVRKPTKKTSDFDKTLAQNGNEVIDLLSPAVLLEIHAPAGMDLRECWLKVDSAVDLEIGYSRSNSTWAFKIAPNKQDPETPTTVNISVGDIQPP